VRAKAFLDLLRKRIFHNVREIENRRSFNIKVKKEENVMMDK